VHGGRAAGGHCERNDGDIRERVAEVFVSRAFDGGRIQHRADGQVPPQSRLRARGIERQGEGLGDRVAAGGTGAAAGAYGGSGGRAPGKARDRQRMLGDAVIDEGQQRVRGQGRTAAEEAAGAGGGGVALVVLGGVGGAAQVVRLGYGFEG